jgi:signal transduction histidine kinase
MMKRTDVLIVEDEGAHRKTLGRLLEPLEMNLSFLDNGKDALLLLEKKDYEIVILDWLMPGMAGIELCARIKIQRPSTRIMMLTAKNSKKDRDTGLSAGADIYITKPYDPDELIDSMQGLAAGFQMDKVNVTGNNELIADPDHPHENVSQQPEVFEKSFVCGMLHNIRTPLSIILNRSQLANLEIEKMGSTVLSTQKQFSGHLNHIEEHHRKIQIAVKKAMNIIEGVLYVNSLDSGKKQILLDLNHLIQQETDFLSADMCIKFHVTTALDLDPNIPMINGIASDFSQVFQNIMKNACEAMKESEIRQLNISTQFDGGKTSIQFRDTGPGMPPSIISKVFIPNHSTKAPTPDLGSGYGLGLYISKRILESYQATISVKETGPEGSTILIEIPNIG